MKTIAAFCCLLLCTSFLLADDDDQPKYPGVKGTDSEITQRLIGTWVGKTKGFRGTLVYKANGECTSDLVPVDFLVKMVASPYSFKGTWRIKEGYLLSTVSESNSKAIAPGTVYRDQPLLLTEDTFVTRNEKNMVTTFKRQRDQ
jgi:hypothetical protein